MKQSISANHRRRSDRLVFYFVNSLLTPTSQISPPLPPFPFTTIGFSSKIFHLKARLHDMIGRITVVILAYENYSLPLPNSKILFAVFILLHTRE